MVNCMVCKKLKKGGDKNVSFHSFPQDPVLRQKWIIALGYKENHQVNDHAKVCSDHFSSSQIEHFGVRRNLRTGSVPALLCAMEKSSATTSDGKSFDVNDDHGESPSALPKNDMPINSNIHAKHDHTYYNGESPVKLKWDLLRMKEKHDLLAKELKYKTAKLNRARNSLKQAQDINKSLRKQALISSDVKSLLDSELQGLPLEIVKRMLDNNAENVSKEQYSPILREFALKLYSYSPKVYSYVCESLGLALPHPSTIRAWNKVTRVSQVPLVEQEQ